jgi:flagellar L-ring protein precursor FlgH
MRRTIYGLIVVIAAIAFLAGCVNHIKPYKPRKRDYRPDLAVIPVEDMATDGSIWTPRANANRFFSDPRASQVNDIVVVRIEEVSKADQGAATAVGRTSELEAQVKSLMGAMKTFQQAHPNFNPESLISSAFKSDFNGGGTTSRSGKVIATVPSLIRSVLPDGNLFIEGHRVVLVNDEEAHFYVSGIIRPYDIDKNNSISSSMIAEAQVEFTGRGVVSEKQSPGWGSRALDYVWPF